MTTKKLRSTPSIEKIHARCIEDGDCLIWQGSTNGAGHCKIANGSGRRIVWQHAKGLLKPGQLLTVTCGQPKCLNPEHLAITSKAEVARINGANPATRAKRVASLERYKRANSAVINMEIARKIRIDPRMGIELAVEFGVSKSLVSRVRTHKAWRERSVFSSLGARGGA